MIDASPARPQLELQSLRASYYESLEALPRAYSSLLEKAAEVNLFLSDTWFENLVRTALKPGQNPRFYGVEREDGTPVLLCPMLSQGSELSSLTNFYTCHYEPISDSSSAAEFEAACRELVRFWDQESRWDSIRLAALNRDGQAFAVLSAALRASRWQTSTFFQFGNWYLEIAGKSFGEYYSGLSSIIQKNDKRTLKKIAEASGTVEVIGAEGDLSKAVEDYVAVYNSSWKVPEPFLEFIPGLVKGMSHQGWLRMGSIHMNGEPVASQIWFVHHGTAYIYKVAYDEKHSKLSLGTTLTVKMMQYVFEVDRVHTVDYLSGDDDYKKHWMSHRREYHGILAFNPRTIRGMYGTLRHIVLPRWKRAVTGNKA